jgi:hypothetical protein
LLRGNLCGNDIAMHFRDAARLSQPAARTAPTRAGKPIFFRKNPPALRWAVND